MMGWLHLELEAFGRWRINQPLRGSQESATAAAVEVQALLLEDVLGLLKGMLELVLDVLVLLELLLVMLVPVDVLVLVE